MEKLRGQMIHALLRRRRFEDARLLGEYWMVIFDATGLFHFKERHCPHCLKKDLHKGTENEKTVYYHHVLEAKIVLGDGFVVSIGTEFIENEDVTKNDCETKALKRLAEKLKKEYRSLCDYGRSDSLDGIIVREYPRKGKVNKNCTWNGCRKLITGVTA